MTKPTKQQIKKWVRALRSGEYSQTTGKLQGEFGYCCMGVACEIFIPKALQVRYNNGFLIGGMPSDQASPAWLKDLVFVLYADISALNDFGRVSGDNGRSHKPFTFDEIADLLEYEYIYEVLS